MKGTVFCLFVYGRDRGSSRLSLVENYEEKKTKMLTTIQKEIEKNNCTLEDTIYNKMPMEILSYPLTIGDFVKVERAEDAKEDFGVIKKYVRVQRQISAENEDYHHSIERLKEVKYRLKMGRPQAEELEQLRKERKALTKKIHQYEEEFEKKAEQTLGFHWKEKKVLCYKNTVYLSWLEDMKSRIHALAGIRLPEAGKIPFFVSKMKSLKKAVDRGEEIGIVGGPCLFGMDEVVFHLTLADGRTVDFDSCCGRRCLNEKQTEDTLEEFVEKYHDVILSVSIENRKSGVTVQEYASIVNLFAFAEVLHAKTVIPLPDISYFKYVESDLKDLKEEQFTSTMAWFREECYKITDYYLALIEKIAKRYPEVEYSVLHARDESLVSIFYEEREHYLKNSSYIQKITNVSGKKDSVIDYITMLALPYYIYGTSKIVQLDSVDETDSGRKCNKIHKGDIRLTQILYPEFLSMDGEHTIYYAPLEYKDYISPDEE